MEGMTFIPEKDFIDVLTEIIEEYAERVHIIRETIVALEKEKEEVPPVARTMLSEYTNLLKINIDLLEEFRLHKLFGFSVKTFMVIQNYKATAGFTLGTTWERYKKWVSNEPKNNKTYG